MRDQTAAAVTTQAVVDPAFWAAASRASYTGKAYDQLRLRPMDKGYFSLITGEGHASYAHEVVVNTAYRYQDRLPRIEDSAIAIDILAEGTDPRSGLPYVDTLFFLDFSLFYGIYLQRSYRLDVGEHTYVFFETLRSDFVDAATWKRYRQQLDRRVETADLRWLLNKVIELESVYGTFIIEPGTVHSTRISFLVQVKFGEQAGLLAKIGSEMPLVLRQGLQTGFENCVRIAAAEQAAQQR